MDRARISTSWVSARLGLLGLTVALLGCPRADAETTPPSPAPETETEAEVETPVDESICGTTGQRFGDYEWIPADSRLSTAILRDDPELDEALRVLAEMSAADEVQLPIHAALDYRNLGLQLASLERVLSKLALDPGELVELHGPAGDVVWLWPSDCPTATLAARALDRLAVQVRVDFERPGVRTGAGDPDRFPFDLVLVGERVALAPLGRGARIGAWLSAPQHDDEGPGAALATIEAAPIRSVLSGPALLGAPEAPDGAPEAPRHRKIRATATAWHDGDDEPQT